MPFGIGDLLSILTGAGFVAHKAVQESREKKNDLTRNELIRLYVEKYTNPKLEEQLRQDITNPEKYDEIWERIEAYKARNGGWYRWNKEHPAWQGVGEKRQPFFTESGSLYANTQYDSTVLSDNRNRALYMLMHTYGKMTVNDATWEARNASEEMLRNWLVKHPAEY